MTSCLAFVLAYMREPNVPPSDTYDGHAQLKAGAGGGWFTFVLVERVERARLPTLDASRALGRDSDINILYLTCTYYNACACLYQHMRDRKNP